MTRRELERWVAANQEQLSVRGVRVFFGFAPAMGRSGGAVWASFLSARGSGRVIRAADGSSRVDAYAFADGASLGSQGHDHVSSAQLDSVSDALAIDR